MKFHYIASQSDGQVTEGEYNASSSEEAVQFLTSKGLRPISLKAAKSFDISKARLFGQSIATSDKVFLTRYLSLMLKAGTDLFKAINVLINDFDKPVVKSLLIEIRANLEKGNPFYLTFAKYPKYFSPVFINLIKAGETSGNLTMVLDNLSIALTREQDLKNKVRSATIYPVILLGMSFLMLFFLVTFAIPKIANVFLATGVRPPLFSRIVFSTGLFLNDNAIVVFPLILILVIGGWYFFSQAQKGRRMVAVAGIHLPVIKTVLEQLALQRFSSVLASLIKAGLPIIDSLEITADAVGSEKLQASLRAISREGIAKGLTIGEAFRREPIFPQVVTNLISVSEKAGHIEDILNTLAGFYESEVDNSLKTLVSFIEPALLLIIGVLIGTIALSVIIPIYQLVGGI